MENQLFKKGETVDFIYGDTDGSYRIVRNSKVTNSYWEDPLLIEFPGSLKDSYYFCNTGDSIQGVWIRKEWVYPPGMLKLWEILYE